VDHILGDLEVSMEEECGEDGKDDGGDDEVL
jgi:hypothetical protein